MEASFLGKKKQNEFLRLYKLITLKFFNTKAQ